MSRREGSHRARRPSIDLLEGRQLLSQVFGHELARPAGSSVVEQGHAGVVALENEAASSGHGSRSASGGPVDIDLHEDAEDIASRGRIESVNSEPASQAPFRPEQAIPPAAGVALARPSAAAPPPHETALALPLSGAGGPPSSAAVANLETIHAPRPRSTTVNRSPGAYLRFPARVALEAALLPARLSTGERAAGLFGLTPKGSDILAEFLPADAASVERAVDRFLDHIEYLGDDLARLSDPLEMLPEPMAWLVAIGSIEVARRWLGRAGEEDRPRKEAERSLDELVASGDQSPVALPGWPCI